MRRFIAVCEARPRIQNPAHEVAALILGQCDGDVQPRKSVQDTCADGDKIAGLTSEAKFAATLKDASCPLAGYVPAMSNAFGFVLDDASVRRAGPCGDIWR